MLNQQQYEATNAMLKAEYKRRISLLQAEFAPKTYESQEQLTKLHVMMTEEVRALPRPTEDLTDPEACSQYTKFLADRDAIQQYYHAERMRVKEEYRRRANQHYSLMAEARREYEVKKAVALKEYCEWMQERQAQKAKAAIAHLNSCAGKAPEEKEGGNQ